MGMQAEAEYWKRSEGYRMGWSDQLLGFDCGGEQWVLEVAFPTGTLKCDIMQLCFALCFVHVRLTIAAT